MIVLLLQNPFIALFTAIALGLALGAVRVGGVSLGASGTLFVALVFGHFGFGVPDGVGTVGLVLFLYAVGIGAGGRFFAALARDGGKLAVLCAVVVACGAAVVWCGARWIGLPADVAAGIFAGGMTSTPALAAATDILGPSTGSLSVGYGIAYPFGVIGVVLFVQLWPRLLRTDLACEGKKLESSEPAEPLIIPATVEVTNPNLAGARISENTFLASGGVQVTRVARDGRLVPLSYDDVFEPGQKLMIVGPTDRIPSAIEFLGRRTPDDAGSLAIDSERERKRVVVTSASIAGRRLGELQTLRNFDLTVSRVSRLGATFVPNATTVVERNDILTAVGSEEGIARFCEAAGHREDAFEETDLLSLACGLALGVALGLLVVRLPDGEGFSLGMAGGPLIAGLLLGHIGRAGRLIGYIPRSTRVFLQELGLAFFLADAGMRGGGQFVATLAEYGPSLFALGAAVTLLPLAIAYFVARHLFQMNLPGTLGGVCGAMTSTPALGAITEKTDSRFPVVSYATAYPIALVFMTLFAKLLIQALG